MRYCFEDLVPGPFMTIGPRPISREEIVEFAAEFDPQPFHLDEEVAKTGFFGDLVASGWHLGAFAFRMIFDAFIRHASSMGAPGVEEVKWLLPVKPGDALTVRLVITDRKESRSRPDMGLARFETTVTNQRGEVVMTQDHWAMFGKRAAPIAVEA